MLLLSLSLTDLLLLVAVAKVRLDEGRSTEEFREWSISELSIPGIACYKRFSTDLSAQNLDLDPESLCNKPMRQGDHIGLGGSHVLVASCS